MAAIERLIGNEPFVLVTSASHMPRALKLAQSRGLHALPAPTDHAARRLYWDRVTDYFPSADGLYRSERACYEYLGLAWNKLARPVTVTYACVGRRITHEGAATMSAVLTAPHRNLKAAVDERTPLWLLRRLLAEALQTGRISAEEGIACMRALDGGDGRRARRACQNVGV